MANDPKQSPLRFLGRTLGGVGIALAVLMASGIAFFVSCAATVLASKTENFNLGIGVGALAAVVVGTLLILGITRFQKSRRRDD